MTPTQMINAQQAVTKLWWRCRTRNKMEPRGCLKQEGDMGRFIAWMCLWSQMKGGVKMKRRIWQAVAKLRYDENLHTLGNWKSQASGLRCLWLGSINSCPSQWRPLGDSSRKSQLTKITFCFSCLSDFEKGLITLTNKAEN